MNIWNGVFLKHRDYRHGSPFEHLMEHGARYGVSSEPVIIEASPATLDEVAPTVAYVVRFVHQTNETYDYFIPSESPLTREVIKAEFDLQVGTSLDGERRTAMDILEYDSYKTYQSLTDEDFDWYRQ